MIILLFVVFTIIALFDVPKLMKSKYWKGLTVYSIFFLTAFILAFLLVLGVNIPSVMLGIEYFIKDILHLHY